MGVQMVDRDCSSERIAHEPPARFLLLRDDRSANRTTIKITIDEEQGLRGIRCPQCRWRPAASSRWYCFGFGTPEPPFKGCGTVWNTFLTRGRCPGCAHQWRWTSCLRCEQWSLHDDWYETSDLGPSFDVNR